MSGITEKDLKTGIHGISESEMLTKCEEWLKGIEADDFSIVPTFSAFADNIKKPRADMHQWLRLHPSAGKQMRDMVADTLAAGAMKKEYEARIATFALKNWCGWEEAPQKKGQKSKEAVDEKKAKEALDAYIAAERRKGFKVV